MRWLIAAMLFAWLPAAAAQGRADRLAEVARFGANPGNLQLFRYVPAGLRRGAALVVVVHGCTASAREIGETSGWLELAERYKFAVLLPQTSRANEPLGGCFRTWEPAHRARASGEPRSIRSMIAWMQARFATSPRKVFVTGMSSGGHVANVMMAAYPEVFAAGAPQSSFPYGCAIRLADLKQCATGAAGRSATQWGDLVRAAYPGYRGRRPRVQIWHGVEDRLIYPEGLAQQAVQWADVLGVGAGEDAPPLLGHRVRVHRDRRGRVAVATVMIAGLGHAVATDPGTGPGQCGAPGPYAADAGVCAAYWTARFFGVVPDEPR